MNHDTDHLEAFRDRGVYRTGHFKLSSGRHSDTYLQCALATQDPGFAHQLGEDLAGRVRDAGIDADLVGSPAIGGILAGFVVATALDLRFVFTERRSGEMTLRRGQHVEPGQRVLIVEDVLTTGGSAREAAEVLEARGAAIAGYAALVDRSTPDHPLPFEAVSLVRVEPQTWDESDCPLCADGAELDSPGSRHRTPG